MGTYNQISLKIDSYNQKKFYSILSKRIENLSITKKNGAVECYIKNTPFKLEQPNKYENIIINNVSEDVFKIILFTSLELYYNQ
ncbi:MAG TPA: hypothetical protein PK784_05515 [Tenuifilaceae bacterium]|nr:hypothetical protein [Tenuifilaceae bacterium]HPN21586.1 hypothetical protein [Tenuifilaceae bacterium]